MRSLSYYLKLAKRKDFVPRLRYYSGDYLSYFAKEDRCVAEQIDDRLVVYKSIKDDSIVGVKILNPTLDIPSLGAPHDLFAGATQ